MSELASRRRIDWDVILPGQPLAPTRVEPVEPPSRLAALTAALTVDASATTLERVLQHAIELARTVIGLERTAIYLLDQKNHAMVGTFGTDADGGTVDERGLSYEFGQYDRDIFARARAGFPWTVYEDCPHLSQRDGKTELIGRGWVACTVILGARGPLGIMFNDAALSHTPVDETKQSRAALLCSLLGRALEPCLGSLMPAAESVPDSGGSAVAGVTELLLRDPKLRCAALAKALKVSPRQLRLAFKREAKTSLVEYRNELRLSRFLECFDPNAHNLLAAAVDAGFGSYTQFHRVFRTRFGRGPREYFYGSTPVPIVTQHKPRPS